MPAYFIINAHVGIDPVMSPETTRNEILDKVRNHGARGIKIQSAAQRFHPLRAVHVALQCQYPSFRVFITRSHRH